MLSQTLAFLIGRR